MYYVTVAECQQYRVTQVCVALAQRLSARHGGLLTGAADTCSLSELEVPPPHSRSWLLAGGLSCLSMGGSPHGLFSRLSGEQITQDTERVSKMEEALVSFRP